MVGCVAHKVCGSSKNLQDWCSDKGQGLEGEKMLLHLLQHLAVHLKCFLKTYGFLLVRDSVIPETVEGLLQLFVHFLLLLRQSSLHFLCCLFPLHFDANQNVCRVPHGSLLGLLFATAGRFAQLLQNCQLLRRQLAILSQRIDAEHHSDLLGFHRRSFHLRHRLPLLTFSKWLSFPAKPFFLVSDLGIAQRGDSVLGQTGVVNEGHCSERPKPCQPEEMNSILVRHIRHILRLAFRVGCAFLTFSLSSSLRLQRRPGHPSTLDKNFIEHALFALTGVRVPQRLLLVIPDHDAFLVH
mmetsp:Transcript_34733/g.83940  ORF Transcript_34733/g.83940 Transcript_34733/m.83940 type:complete len:296 (+) Transcript_34733:551-1438(+)